MGRHRTATGPPPNRAPYSTPTAPGTAPGRPAARHGRGGVSATTGGWPTRTVLARSDGSRGTFGHRHRRSRPRLGRGACPSRPRRRRSAGRGGDFRLVAPREVGGWEAPLPDQLLVHEALGAADPSAAWCVTNAAVAGRAAAYLDDDARDRLFAWPPRPTAFSNLVMGRATPIEGGDGGYGSAAAGRWSVAPRTPTGRSSAPGHARCGPQEGATASSEGPARGRAGCCCRPRAGASSATWDDAGAMRGSGSHTLRVAGALGPGGLRPLVGAPAAHRPPAVPAALHLGHRHGGRRHQPRRPAQRRSSNSPPSCRPTGRRSTAPRPRDWPNVQQAVAELTASRAPPGAACAPPPTTCGPPRPTGPARRFRRPCGRRPFRRGRPRRAGGAGRGEPGLRVRHGQVLRRGHPLELALRDVHGMAVNWERIRRMLFDAGGVLLGREPRYRAM